MTAEDLFGVMWRRRLTVLVGLLLTGLACFWVQAHATTVYYTRFVVQLHTPEVNAEAARRNRILGNLSPNAIASAYLLTALVNGGIPSPKSSMSEATLYGEGYLNTTSARILSTGNQWYTNVSAPTILVEVTRPTPAEVSTEVNHQVGVMQDKLSSLQTQLGVRRQRDLVTMQVTPTTPSVTRIDSNPARALVGTVLCGLGATVALAYWRDRWARRRPAQRRTRRTRVNGSRRVTS